MLHPPGRPIDSSTRAARSSGDPQCRELSSFANATDDWDHSKGIDRWAGPAWRLRTHGILPQSTRYGNNDVREKIGSLQSNLLCTLLDELTNSRTRWLTD